MNFYAHRLLSSAAYVFLLFYATSCGEELNDAEATPPEPQAVVVFSPGGLGDQSYNDCILQGVQQFKKEHGDIGVYISSPGSLKEAERIFSDWLKRPESDIPELLVMASSDYEQLADSLLAIHKLTDNKRVLLFESRKSFADSKIRTFQMSMYGASYLAGAMAAECAAGEKSLVVLANPTDGPIAVARDGFMAGNGGNGDVVYLADDWTGYIASTLAYQNMSQWAQEYGFIFPVAGGSNLGIYRYSREYQDTPCLAGMDVDQSGLSDKITGSVIKHIDRLVYGYLTEWANTQTMPESQLYGLESGYVDWELSSRYAGKNQDKMNGLWQQAIEKEREYNERNNR